MGFVFISLSCVLGVIRVISGVHFLKDVLAGITAAAVVYIIMLIAM